MSARSSALRYQRQKMFGGGLNVTTSHAPDNAGLPGGFVLVRVPCAELTNSSAHSVPTHTSGEFTHPFDTVSFDNDNMANLTDDQLVVRTPGYYLVTANVVWAANTVNSRGVYIRKNTTTIGRVEDRANTTTASPETSARGTTQYVGAIAEFNEGDTIDLRIFQSSGGNLNSNTGSGYAPTLRAVFVSLP